MSSGSVAQGEPIEATVGRRLASDIAITASWALLVGFCDVGPPTGTPTSVPGAMRPSGTEVSLPFVDFDALARAEGLPPPRTALARRLLELRARARARGQRFLTAAELDAELEARRSRVLP